MVLGISRYLGTVIVPMMVKSSAISSTGCLLCFKS